MLCLFSSGRWGHYSQIVWWNSRLVGCGASMYTNGRWTSQLLFCNYGSTGNIIRTKMYEVGHSGSNCPPGTSRSDPEYKALCGKITLKWLCFTVNEAYLDLFLCCKPYLRCNFCIIKALVALRGDKKLGKSLGSKNK